jgi:hypothetical protein
MSKGINYGHHLLTSEYNTDSRLYEKKVRAEMLEILEQGFDCIRLDYPQANSTNWNQAALERRKLNVRLALSLGFKKVLWGTVHERPVVTASNYVNSRNFILNTLLPWAESLADNRLCMSIGNEEEPHVDGTTMTAQNMRNNIIQLASDAQNIYTYGPIYYDASIDSIYGGGNVWADNQIGSLDMLGINVYKGVLADYAGFRLAIADINRFGDKIYCGEWNTGNGFDDMLAYGRRYSEEMYTKVNIARRDVLDAYNIEWYFFAYSANSVEDFQPNAFALKKGNGTYHDLWYVL